MRDRNAIHTSQWCSVIKEKLREKKWRLHVINQSSTWNKIQPNPSAKDEFHVLQTLFPHSVFP